MSRRKRLLAAHQFIQQHVLIYHLGANRFDHHVDDPPLEDEGRFAEIIHGGLTVATDVQGFVDLDRPATLPASRRGVQ